MSSFNDAFINQKLNEMIDQGRLKTFTDETTTDNKTQQSDKDQQSSKDQPQLQGERVKIDLEPIDFVPKAKNEDDDKKSFSSSSSRGFLDPSSANNNNGLFASTMPLGANGQPKWWAILILLICVLTLGSDWSRIFQSTNLMDPLQQQQRDEPVLVRVQKELNGKERSLLGFGFFGNNNKKTEEEQQQPEQQEKRRELKIQPVQKQESTSPVPPPMTRSISQTMTDLFAFSPTIVPEPEPEPMPVMHTWKNRTVSQVQRVGQTAVPIVQKLGKGALHILGFNWQKRAF